MAEAVPVPMEVDEQRPVDEDAKKKKPMKKKKEPTYEAKEPKKDFGPEVEAAVVKATQLAKDGDLAEGLNVLLPLEKASRVAQDAPACSSVVVAMTRLCFENSDWDRGIVTVTMLSKRRSALNTPITDMVRKAMEFIDQSPSEDKRVALIEALRTITEGKIFLELESARLTKLLAAIKEKNGDIAEAATIMQEVA
eukprot:Stramenopile-MAST_4_protein_5815